MLLRKQKFNPAQRHMQERSEDPRSAQKNQHQSSDCRLRCSEIGSAQRLFSEAHAAWSDSVAQRGRFD